MQYTMMKRCLMWTLWALLAASTFGCESKQPADTKEQPANTKEGETKTAEHSPDNGEWCKGHGLPESHCTKCHPELIDKFKAKGDWCKEHGFPESACPTCNPMDPPGATETAEHSPTNGEWCKGHGLPESHCTKCHPELIDKFKAKGDWCKEHGFPESACPTCNPMDPPGATETAGIAPIPGIEPGTQIIFKQDDHEQAVGIETVPAKKVPVGLGTRAPARIEFDRNQLADVRAAVPGIVREVLVDLGQEVDEGTPLFVLESARVGEVQAKVRAASEELKTARANLERQKKLFEKGLSAERKVEVAERDFQEAKARVSSLRSSLRLAGGSGSSSTGRYTIRAPIAGTIVDRPGVVGAFATEETSLATVADTSKMWAMLDVAEGDSFALENGQPVTLAVDGATGRKFDGQVTWISPQVDPRTRTVKVRAEIDNADGKLRANQFARAEIGIAPDKKGVVVPKEAIQSLEDGTVVFVRKKQGQYEPRIVEAGRSDGDVVQVRGNLRVGEPVVTTGAFILKTELSRDSIGAGCCEVPGQSD
ncbi:efflux RND transporter periplasmic adaptor subunit [Persicimonas caeni]|nr:efflux RND transporter periplasmic adaptor subunit [Persicimonas caeni]